MFDLGWTELLVVGIVALIVVGPKDLPVLFRSLGRFMGKARGMAREFTQAMNDAADEAGVSDIQKTFKNASNPVSSAMDEVKNAAKSMADLDPNSHSGKLSAERADAKKKIELSAAKAAAERKAREASEAAAKVGEMEAEIEASAGSDVPDTKDKT
ncbi:Sec-independent protein translocase protein TatB [Marivita sp. GX14005]|uniref:Sec-independent protein translocase protein TatB n=1 Tax=Marivita sp. GX14005 TaxID=2942276 RepID=UPI0020190447|nr:Sec-independent protein translocase protein TatB [Marivita sp. GX14005]MCL3883584.1 Sec-independent protein translocase protein TatB [Marivita sp. GX14005]